LKSISDRDVEIRVSLLEPKTAYAITGGSSRFEEGVFTVVDVRTESRRPVVGFREGFFKNNFEIVQIEIPTVFRAIRPIISSAKRLNGVTACKVVNVARIDITTEFDAGLGCFDKDPLLLNDFFKIFILCFCLWLSGSSEGCKRNQRDPFHGILLHFSSVVLSFSDPEPWKSSDLRPSHSREMILGSPFKSRFH
jgi:hypothetical protein